jgi:DNA-binding response OmpR family regulator
MITTKSQESDKIRGLKAGADVYIGKPFIQTSLLETIAKLLKKREAEA